ncbi:LTA synthase family protein [Candidatus Aalborgicola defluviihabitans]|uniref:LTA synthase family protein n=1 Tax=Candidatus Aalborgicola defluviihabitans TaxID=3386187 RepID=UPI00390975C7|nr:sulfatase-like hydrolase/transferase [Burkholderiales bacterium]
MKPAIARTLTTLVHGLLRGLFRAWVLVVPLVLALSLIRLGQLAYFWPTGFHVSTTDLASVVVQGFRFDLKVSAVAGFLLLLVLPWVSGKVQGRIATGVAFLYVMLSLVNLHYFGFYKTPIDSLVFGVVEDDTSAVLQTIWHDFPVIWTLLLALALTAGSVWLHRVLLRRLRPDTVLQSRHIAIQLALAIVVFFALVFAGKGTLREMALQRQHLTVTTSPFLNDMVPNGPIALKYAWDSRGQSQNLQNPLVGLKAMGFNSPLAAAEALGLPHGSEAEVKAALTAHEPLPPGTPKKNLIFFLMESWSAEPLLYQSSQFDVLGRLAPTLMDPTKACHFSNFDSAQPGTHPTLEAILFSTPITPLTMGDVGRKPIPWSIPKVIKDAGYQTLFVTSARSGWRDLNRVLAVQGFDEVVDANNLKESYPDATLGIWGVWDSYVFKYLDKRLAAQPKDKPLFVFVLTSTNHPPYDLPADYHRVPRDMSLWKGETSSDTLLLNLDTYHYAADLLGGFVQSVQSGPLKSNTIVAATGDHNVRSFGMYAEPARRYLQRQVPFVIWGEGLQCGPQQALPASHRDMFNTLLPLIGVNGPYVNAGRNLLRTPQATPMDAPRTLFFQGESRNAQGQWQLGNKASFACSSPPGAQPAAGECQFNASDDQQERARFGLLDWNVRSSLKK